MVSSVKKFTGTILFVFLFTACQSAAPSPEKTLLNFLQALTDKNQAVMLSLVCPDYELDALLEFDSYALVSTTLNEADCRQISGNDDEAQIVCAGTIETSYNGELQSIDLSTRTYTVVNVESDWLVCGYKK